MFYKSGKVISDQFEHLNMFSFWGNNKTGVAEGGFRPLGNFSHVGRLPPPPPQYGNAHVKNIVFFPEENFFFKKIKHVLAPQDDFGMQKNLVNKYKQVGLGQTPPSLENIPT